MVVFEGVAYVLWLAPINIGLDKQQAKRRDFINIGLNKATFHRHDMKVKNNFFYSFWLPKILARQISLHYTKIKITILISPNNLVSVFKMNESSKKRKYSTICWVLSSASSSWRLSVFLISSPISCLMKKL